MGWVGHRKGFLEACHRGAVGPATPTRASCGPVEGLSLLILLFLAVPLRVYGGLHDPVWYVGWTHGLLFLTYGFFALAISHLREWSILRWLATFLLGAVPFGFLVVDGQLKRALRLAEDPGAA